MERASLTMTSSELEEVLAGLRSFIAAEVVPRHAAMASRDGDRVELYDSGGRFTPAVLEAMTEVRMAAAAAGYYTMLAPTTLGGGGLGFEALFRAWETIYHLCGARHWLGYSTVAHWSRGPSEALTFATPAARDLLLPRLLDGSATLCFAMSEPDAGSDVWMMQAAARRAPGGWLLSGTKQWITNGPYADFALVFAVTDRALFAARRGGVTAFVMPADAPGLHIDRVIEMFGHRGGDEAIIGLTDVFVPDDFVVGEVDGGLRLAMSCVADGRLYNAARSVGLARWALEMAVAYAEDRSTFGTALIENQGVAFPLADSAVELHAARLIGLDCARALDAGRTARQEVTMAKLYATEMAVRVVDRAMQVHGAMGFTNELGLSEAWQQVRRICVADGASEILRMQVVKHLRQGSNAVRL